MVTSIQLSEDTKALLESFKNESHKTYDDVVKHLVKLHRPRIRKLFAKHPSKKSLPKSEWRADIRDF